MTGADRTPDDDGAPEERSPDAEAATDADASGQSPGDGGADGPPADRRPEARRDEMSDRTRRWLIRLLVGLGIGIPVLIEGRTFLGLVGSHFGDGSDPATSTPTPTPASNRVGVGDELLPATSQREVLSDAVVNASGDGWTFRAVVSVRNTAEVPYEVRLGAVTTDGGRTVRGGASSGLVAPGEAATVVGTWSLPAGDQPRRLVVSGITHGETTTRVREDVRLASIPVKG